MPKVISLILLILFLGESYGQGYELANSHDLDYIPNHELGELICADTSGYYVSFYKAEKGLSSTVIRKYSKDFEVKWTKNYAPEGIFYGFTNTKDHIFRIGTEKTGKKKFDYFIQPIAKNGKVYKRKILGTYEDMKMTELPFVESVTSPDSTKFAFILIQDSQRQEDKFHFAVKIFDDQLREKFSRKFNFKQFESQVDILSTGINNNGVVFIVTKEYETVGISNEYKVNVYAISGNLPVKQINVPLDGKYFTYINLNPLSNGNTVLTGIFENSISGKPRGYHHLLMDSIGQNLSSTKELFPPSARNYFSHETSIAVVNNQILNEKGNIVFTLEDNFYFSSKKDDGFGNIKWINDQVSRNIYLTTLSMDGELLGMKKIPKFQVNPEEKFNSHFVSYFPEKGTYIFYNAKSSNLDKKVNEKTEQLLPINKSVLVSARFTDENVLKRIPLIHEKQTGTVMIPKSVRRVTENSIAFLALPENADFPSFQLGKIGLK